LVEVNIEVAHLLEDSEFGFGEEVRSNTTLEEEAREVFGDISGHIIELDSLEGCLGTLLVDEHLLIICRML
jgi:hypothetical protein